MSEVHAQARTTPRTRAEIKNSTASLLELAKRYNISVATARNTQVETARQPGGFIPSPAQALHHADSGTRGDCRGRAKPDATGIG